MDLRPIKTEHDYQDALALVDSLFDVQPNTPAGDQLDILATLIDAYEGHHFPIPVPDPVVALEYYLESRGLTRRDLEPYIGSRARVSEILNRKRPLTLPMIRRLHTGLGLPADVLIQPITIPERAA